MNDVNERGVAARVTVRLTAKQLAAVDELAERYGRSRSEVVRDAVDMLRAVTPQMATVDRRPRPDLVLLTKAVNRLGNNVNQAVARLHREGGNDAVINELLGRMAMLDDFLPKAVAAA